jgi:hypothetical protein
MGKETWNNSFSECLFTNQSTNAVQVAFIGDTVIKAADNSIDE